MDNAAAWVILGVIAISGAAMVLTVSAFLRTRHGTRKTGQDDESPTPG